MKLNENYKIFTYSLKLLCEFFEIKKKCVRLLKYIITTTIEMRPEHELEMSSERKEGGPNRVGILVLMRNIVPTLYLKSKFLTKP